MRMLVFSYKALIYLDHIYEIRSAPVEANQKNCCLWHIQFISRFTKVTGFELGSGMDINTALPDETVKFMRQVIVCCHR